MTDRAFKEPDDVAPKHHVIYRRSVLCGTKGCRHTAHRWARCATCKEIVARCGGHDHHLEQQVREHCAVSPSR